MAFHKKFVSTAMAVFVVVVMATASLTEAQQQIPSCATKLAQCADFITNSTIKPDTACCNSIKDAVTNDLSCLCTLYTTPGLLASFNINVTDALRVSRDCNVNTDLSVCNSTGTAAPTPPPGVPGGDDNGAGRVAWTGITSLLLFWASMMLY
ncbi:hypothetical protein ACOSP7_025583 [Xanthoceras sorbifolium]|uniref:Bifunctional inhibitor/plant lipid transfer protein/seed storage helical domain-containing protein n=1 Tax=Xanthoceras sorbifolium TaxID=99658 RepID=A0ABQ8H6L7_9ROSI|nr:hypothetical protein JRO89_XS13G0050600 [Xanthoceras sorbifolium]